MEQTDGPTIDVEPEPQLPVPVDRGMVRVVGTPGGVVAVLGEYSAVQKALDKAMPDCIMSIKGKQFRKKKYWRGVKTQFGLSVMFRTPYWMLLVREDGGRDIVPYSDDAAISVPGGNVIDWGFQVMCRATHGPSGIFQDGLGACMASEKFSYVKNGREFAHDDEGRRVIDWDKTEENASVHNVLSHAQTRAENRAIADLVGFGEVSAEELPSSMTRGGGAPATKRTAARPSAKAQTAPRDDTDDEPAAHILENFVGKRVEGKCGTLQTKDKWKKSGTAMTKWFTCEGRKVMLCTRSNPESDDEAKQWGIGSDLNFLVDEIGHWDNGTPFAYVSEVRPGRLPLDDAESIGERSDEPREPVETAGSCPVCHAGPDESCTPECKASVPF